MFLGRDKPGAISSDHDPLKWPYLQSGSAVPLRYNTMLEERKDNNCIES